MLAELGDVALHYEEAGSGQPLVLIHGFPLSGAIWKFQLQGLSSDYRVITPDLRGFGKSSVPEGDYSMDLFADDVVSLLDHLGIDRAVFCGMSMGGYVVMNLARRYPERVKGICLMVTRGGADDEAGKMRRTVLACEVLKTGATAAAGVFSSILFAPETANSQPELLEEVRQIMMAADPAGLAGGLLAMRDRDDFSGRLGEFGCPALVVGALDDMAIPPDESRLLSEGLKGSTLCMIEGAGHMVMLEKPAEVNLALRQFLMAS